MKKCFLLFFTIIMVLVAASGCSGNEQSKAPKEQKKEAPKQKVELTVSAAASLQDALSEIKTGFEKDHPNITIVYNFGASGALQQQINQGAPVDLFFSADKGKFDQLVNDGLIEKEKDLVGNSIVLVVPNDSTKGIHTIEDITKADKISIGTPETVPAGKYGKEVLESLNVWKAVEGKIIPAKDVRQVLTYVETGNVDAGIVYKSDASISSKVKVVATAADDTHEPIIYPAGVIKKSAHPKEAQQFFKYLQNNNSIKTLVKYGFDDLKK